MKEMFKAVLFVLATTMFSLASMPVAQAIEFDEVRDYFGRSAGP